MPDTLVFLSVGGNLEQGILFSQKGKGEVPQIPNHSSLFDPAVYGRPLATLFDANSHFDREFQMILDIWMDHCHNLDHAVVGMTLHLAYEGITTPFEVGTATHNHPE